jgi:hypothetical protein
MQRSDKIADAAKPWVFRPQGERKTIPAARVVFFLQTEYRGAVLRIKTDGMILLG